MNIKVRLKNPVFWTSLIAQIIVICQIIGIDLVGMLPILENYEQVIKAIFVILATLGVVNDPTTKGFKDSLQALGYNKPRAPSK